MSIDLGRELGKAREQLQLGNKTEAARLSRRLAKRFKTSAEPCVLLAEAEQAQGQIEKSCKAMRDACRRSPRSAQLFAAYGDLCMAAEQFDNALGGYRSALALEPGALPYKSRLAAALQAVGSIADATVLHREVLEASPNDAQAHFNVGTALKRAHDFAGALAAFRNAVDRAPHDGRLRFALATLLIETEAFALAVEHLDWLIEREIDLPAALHACAYANKKLGRGAASVVAAERLVLCTEGSHGAALALSAAHIGAQQFGPALTIIERELERQPDSRQLWSDQAIALSALGRKGDARQLFDTENLLQVIDITPPAEFDDIHRFNEALQAHVERHPSLDFSGISMSCHEGATSSELF
ncbi:MAG: tetratricopeptide repeat protein, partial [Chromatiales bacterium]|nr:tetratricopeptide repeat protein [Chromatiales bacterium]